MNLLELSSVFPDEASCRQKYREHQKQVGVSYTYCGSVHYYRKNHKKDRACNSCTMQTYLTYGSVTHQSELPYRYWFIKKQQLTSVKKDSWPGKLLDNWDTCALNFHAI